MSTNAGEEGDLREIDRWEGGVGWFAHPDERMQRASHALAVDGEVWVVDPVDAPGVDDLLAGLGEVTGVVVCLDRHARDAAALARRHDVPVYLPGPVGDGVDLDVESRRVDGRLPGSPYEVRTVVNWPVPPWREAALVDPEGGTLYVPEAVGTASFFRTRSERLGVHPVLRPVPPRGALAGLDPERVLVGHGEGVDRDAAGALREALAGARSRMLSLYWKNVRSVVGGNR